MGIKAADVAKLRAMTGAGMMDCKNALQDANGDFTRAQEIIREKGKLIASKRADRSATEGQVVSKIVGNNAYLLGLACETDFVAMGEEFAAKANEFLNLAIEKKCTTIEELEKLVADQLTDLSGKTGEKIELPFFAKIESPHCATYIHNNNKLGTIIGFNMKVTEDVAKDVAMQATAMAPVSISETDIDPAVIDSERKIGMEQARQEGKPENLLERIALGKVERFIKDNTLLNQTFVKDNKLTVAQYIDGAVKGATVVAYKRFSLTD